ncbi:YaaA family protein [Leifsonia shinshuensis]|uniref:Peroxide stress protein YaaA n=1 Tax=Leifsonia shinshuensis TaxID=150026 RepID=A0A7G6Y8H8_9MICO|nr:peroxide stress protein YaaA [Leifsonia shinshuensis]QNE34793.1 peroxide stress protein YaaA [Leifsonia shinshuensis]
MLVLLPPSETKRDGGEATPLAVKSLGFPALNATRRGVVADTVALSRTPEAAAKALKLGPKQASEIVRNRGLRRAETMPALLRYTGVLYDALDAPSLTEEQWRFAARSVAVQSALLGLVRADDRIPAYRLSFDSRLSPTLKKRWAEVCAAELAVVDGVILDLRSEGYAALGPLPEREGVHYLRVLARDESGTVRALNHFNKQAKGLFTRAILEHGEDFASTDALLAWAAAEGYELTRSVDRPGELDLVVPEVVGVPGKLSAVLRSAS